MSATSTTPLGIEFISAVPDPLVAHLIAASGGGVSHDLDALRANLWLAASDAGNNLMATPYRLTAAALYFAGVSNTLPTGSSPSVIALPTGDVSLCYVASGAAQHARYSKARGVISLQTVAATATAVAHTVDRMGRLICAVYNARWYVVVGLLNSDGATWTFSAPVSMALSDAAGGASMRCLPDGSLSFAYVGSSGAASLARCRSLKNDGSSSTGWV